MSRSVRLSLLVCAAVAALSLLVADQVAYDPQAWLIWGRQISEGTLETVAGPSWKPLPVLVTAPSALLGDTAAPLIWLWVARTGGLMAFALAGLTAVRLAGGRWPVVAAGVAVAALLLANTFLSGVMRGNSEGLLVAVVLAAVLAALDGRLHVAFGFGVAAALLRPEAWPLLALYSLWLISRERRSPRVLALVAGAAVLVLVLWFVPEKIGSGDFFRGASRAREPVADSPAQAAFPFGAVFTNGAKALVYPVYALALLAVVDAFRRRRTALLVVAGVATAWMLAVAVLAQNGFTGNLRYVLPPAALLAVLAGAGVALLPRRPWLLAIVALAAVPGVIQAVRTFDDSMDRAIADERAYDELPRAIAKAGGAAAVKSCGHVVTGPFQTQAVAWQLHLREQQVGLDPDVPGTVLARRGLAITRDDRFHDVAVTPRWVVRQSC